MTVFTDAGGLYDLVAPFLREVTSDDELRPKFVASGTSFRVNYHDPSAVLLLDATVDPPQVFTGDDAAGRPAEVELFMSGDDGHQFWLGELNIPIALARRKVRTSGNLTRMLGLLPALKPAYARYRTYLAANGHADLA